MPVKTKKTKDQLLEEIEQKNSEIKELKKDIEKLDKYKAYNDAGEELFGIVMSFNDAGFTRAEAFELVKVMLANSLVSNNEKKQTIDFAYTPVKRLI